MWPTLVECLESNVNIKTKLSFLNSLINVNAVELKVEDENTVKQKIREFCADGAKRNEGLLLLYAVIQSNSTLYVDNWGQLVLGSLKCPDSFISREIPFSVLGTMIEHFGRMLNHSETFSRVMPEIFTILLEPENDKAKLYFHTLSLCMKFVPEISGNHLEDIEKLLINEMDNPYGEMSEAIGECFAAIPMCILYTSKIQPIIYKDAWFVVFAKILNTMHSLLNSLLRLSEDQEEYVNVSQLDVYNIPCLVSNDVNPITQIDVFKSLCQCLAKMMSSENRFVRVPVTEVLQSLLRIFQVVKMMKVRKQDPKVKLFIVGFPQLLNGAYIVLEALIVNFHIIEQSHNFMVMITMSLNAMKEIFLPNSVNQLRGTTWKLINVWLETHGTKGSYELAKDKTILEEILADIYAQEKKPIVAAVEESKNEKSNANQIFACTHALKVLKNLIETSSCYMDANSIDKISSTLLRDANTVVYHTIRASFPLPYTDQKCRKLLYDALNTCAIFSNPQHSRCIMRAQNIFKIASKDRSPKVRRVCHRFRKLSRNYLNPRKPPPEAMQYSHSSMLNNVQQPVIESLKAQWNNGMHWNNENGHSGDDQMDDSEADEALRENSYSDKMESESNLMPGEEVDMHVNHDYRRVAKQSSQSLGEEESVDDSDLEPTYVSNNADTQRIDMNDSRINSFNMQSSVEQYANEARTERRSSEEINPCVTNSVENNTEEQASFNLKFIHKPPQVPMGNGEWKKKENNESEEEESEMDEEGDEGEANEENEGSDNAGDEASDGKNSPEYDEETPRKRQKLMEEEGDDVDEDAEDEDNPANNPSSDEEGNDNNVPILEQNEDTNAENYIEENQDDTEDVDCGSPTIREMCGDFVLAEPASEMS